MAGLNLTLLDTFNKTNLTTPPLWQKYSQNWPQMLNTDEKAENDNIILKIKKQKFQPKIETSTRQIQQKSQN